MSTVPLPIQGQPRSAPVPEQPAAVLALGFRPFFLAATTFAAAAMLGWLLCLAGVWSPSASWISPIGWHAHEMVFGYAMAVVAGFLLTASRNWTGRDTPTGGRLLALVGTWALGRIAMSGVLPVPGWAVAWITLLFPIGLWLAVASVIVPAKSKRNYGILAVLGALAALQATFHFAGDAGWAQLSRAALFGAVHLIVLLHVVIGGRVIPMFTQNALMARGLGVLPTTPPGLFSAPQLGKIGIGLSVAVAVLATVAVAGLSGVTPLLAGVAALAAAVHLLRMRTWRTPAAMRVPMLAVLHAGHLWIVVGYLLLSYFAAQGVVAAPAATHAFTVGVFGTMTVGMMARVSLGHTGRPIEADARIIAAFVAMAAAAFFRVGGALIVPGELFWSRTLPGVLFAVSALALLSKLAGILTKPRPDGRPG